MVLEAAEYFPLQERKYNKKFQTGQIPPRSLYKKPKKGIKRYERFFSEAKSGGHEMVR